MLRLPRTIFAQVKDCLITGNRYLRAYMRRLAGGGARRFDALVSPRPASQMELAR
jgi:hypothetical protein